MVPFQRYPLVLQRFQRRFQRLPKAAVLGLLATGSICLCFGSSQKVAAAPNRQPNSQVTVDTATGQRLAQVLPPLPTSQGANQPPVTVPSSGAVAERYMVFVNGNSPLLLEQVRQVQPDAFSQTHNGRSVIQAGLYNSQQNAQAQVQRLSAVGIGASVVTVQRSVAAAYGATVPPPPGYSAQSGSAVPIPVTAVPDHSVAFGQAPNRLPAPPSSAALANASRAYYVVVPSGPNTVASLGNQLVTFGVASRLVQTRSEPFGPHVAVGPFGNRAEAEEWNQYLRGFGVDARVHFQR